jgi:chromosome segregation ATPase
MREQLERRLEELKKEFTSGQARVAELEKQHVIVQQTLLRISGAIQVLEEELKLQPHATAHINNTIVDNAVQTDLSRTNGSLDHVVT